MTVLFVVAVLGLLYFLRIWWNDGKTWKPMIGRVRSRIRDLLGVVSQDQMNGMQKHFQQKEQAWEKPPDEIGSHGEIF